MLSTVITIIRENLIEIIPELEVHDISNDATFIELGANSVDRGELITLTLERLELQISRIEFVKASSISELADLIVQRSSS